ncbi:MAG: hypothetical protein JXB08_01980 [Bacilli bacterium]|nr:hypothetical protein [Bacilli bacterium]MBN2876046.1 hypothetical protein [Bacilli bacterium]
MKCKLCDRYFLLSQGFQSLFEFPEICPDCYLKFAPKHEYDVIPTSAGVLEHHYLYHDINVNLNQRHYLQRHLRLLYTWLDKEADNRHIQIFINPMFLRDHHQEIAFLCERNSVILLSLIRCNLEGFMSFQ